MQRAPNAPKKKKCPHLTLSHPQQKRKPVIQGHCRQHCGSTALPFCLSSCVPRSTTCPATGTSHLSNRERMLRIRVSCAADSSHSFSLPLSHQRPVQPENWMWRHAFCRGQGKRRQNFGRTSGTSGSGSPEELVPRPFGYLALGTDGRQASHKPGGTSAALGEPSSSKHTVTCVSPYQLIGS